MEDRSDPAWHVCDVPLKDRSSKDAEVVIHSVCSYRTKNRNSMRVHLRTKHNIYYCGYCREKWYGLLGQKQMWKSHMETDCSKK
jgi:hypothetical protein